MNDIPNYFYDQASPHIESANTIADFKEIISKYHAQVLDDIYKKETKEANISLPCEKGCHYCCHIPVSVFAIEMLLITDFIKSNLSANKIKQLCSQEYKTKVTCPLLENGSCSIYPVRPATYRIFHSLDKTFCEAYYKSMLEQNCKNDQGNLYLPELKDVGQSAITEFVFALDAAGYDSRPYDLKLALYEALSAKELESDFLQKKDVFSSKALDQAYILATRA